MAKNGIGEAAVLLRGWGRLGVYTRWPMSGRVLAERLLKVAPFQRQDQIRHVTEVHDRMPVIVPPDKYDLWLDPDVNNFEAIRGSLKPYDASLMRRYPVSRKLNNSKNDDAECGSARHIGHSHTIAIVLSCE